ncbi:MAG: VWA domain-containing protein [Clostridia bacterium]|nr:VWA domain-containing protein [Clostridia bacterium]
MKNYFRFIVPFLIFFIIFSTFNCTFYTKAASNAQPNLEYTTLTLVSNYSNETKINLYKRVDTESDNLFVSITDLRKLTKCEATFLRSNSKKITGIRITQGIRKIEIDIEKGILSEFGKKYPITVVHKTNYYLPAIPILKYLGADSYVENDTLHAIMPPTTLWDAMNFNAKNIQWTDEAWMKAHGGERSAKFSLAIDIIMDQLNPLNNQTLFGSAKKNSEKYIKDAFYNFFDVNMYSYSSASKALKVDTNNVENYIFNLIKTDELAIDKLKLIDKSEKEIIEYLEMKISELLKKQGHHLGKGEYEYLHSICKDASRKSVAKIKLENLNKKDRFGKDVFENSFDFACMAVDIYASTTTLMQYCNDSIDVLNSVFSDETAKTAGLKYRDKDISNVANDLYHTLSSKKRVYMTSIADGLLDYLDNKLIDFSEDFVFKNLIGENIGYWFGYFKIGACVASLIMYDEMEAYHADVVSAYLVGLQQYSANVYIGLVEKAEKENFTNEETLVLMRDSLLFFCRSSIAINECLKKNCKAFGGKNKKEAIEWLDERSNIAAYRTYLLTTCSTAPLEEFVDKNADNSSGASGTKVPISSASRFTVLVLDPTGTYTISSGWFGTNTVTVGSPLSTVKEAASSFVEQTLNENADNYIAVVSCTRDWNKITEFSNDKAELKRAINSIQELDDKLSFDINESLKTADRLLSQVKAKKDAKKNLVVFSGCMPCSGEHSPSGHYVESDYEYYVSETGIMVYEFANIAYNTAERLKEKGYNIYTLGCYTNLNEHPESYAFAQRFMEDIQNRGYYNAERPEDLKFFFNDVSDMINGKNYILIKIACPVDVTVSYGGEVLSSKENGMNKRTSFGSLSFAGENDEVKVVRLRTDNKYKIVINGTGEGEMNYSVQYPNEDGEYVDCRVFPSVKIYPTSIITSDVDYKSKKTRIDVDDNGDGRTDISYAARENEMATEVKDRSTAVVFVSIIIIAVCGYLILRLKKKKA